MKTHTVANTRRLGVGDQLVYQKINPGSETPSDRFLYERRTSFQLISPRGIMLSVNAQGEPGKLSINYMACTQEENGDIFFYGNVASNGPISFSNITSEQWITSPKSGRALLYPGRYVIGANWRTKYTLPNADLSTLDVDLLNEIDEIDSIQTAFGPLECYVVRSYFSDGKQDSITWFSIVFGVNVKRLSFGGVKPGFLLSSYQVGEIVLPWPKLDTKFNGQHVTSEI